MTFNKELLEQQRRASLKKQALDSGLAREGLDFVVESDRHDYAYQWDWLGLPILQLPQDVVAIQEILFRCQPSIVIEAGVAWGGGTALMASVMDSYRARGLIAIDLNLADSVKDKVEKLEFKTPVHWFRGSSTDPKVLDSVRSLITPEDTVMVLLDSDHSHDHVLSELASYGPLVTPGQYCIVSDTIVEFMPKQDHRPRDWGPGSNPWTAVQQFLQTNFSFQPDAEIDHKLIISFNPGGYLVKG